MEVRLSLYLYFNDNWRREIGFKPKCVGILFQPLSGLRIQWRQTNLNSENVTLKRRASF